MALLCPGSTAVRHAAIAIAEAHELSAQPILCVAPAMMGLVDVGQARFQAAEVRGWIGPKGRCRQTSSPPALLFHRALGMLRVGQGRLHGALAAFCAAERLQGMLLTPHALTAQMREFIVLTLLRLVGPRRPAEVLADLSDHERRWGGSAYGASLVCLADRGCACSAGGPWTRAGWRRSSAPLRLPHRGAARPRDGLRSTR